MTDQFEAPPSTGLVAGKYQLIGLIGRGGMGSVWEGRHVSLGTRVAVKFIETEYASSAEARSRFDNEARAAASIGSKHAIQIHDHGVTDDGKPYIVMELLQGEPLDKRVERLGRMSLQETARILQQVCRALSRAHERGIIHRDLKPENIFVVRDDDGDELAKVLDFGIAKIKGAPGEKGVTSSTKTGAVLGTPFFMSPEQARGLRNIDHRTDLWSLGVIAYKCVTGALPFDGESVGDLLVKICTAPPPIPSHRAPGLPASFDAWFARALEREPERRFSSATELADALAYTAGITVRRPGQATGSTPGHSATLAIGTGSGPVATPGLGRNPSYPSSPGGPGPGVTSAPFVTSARPASSRGRWFTLTAIAIGMMGVGGVTAVLLVKRHPPQPAALVQASAHPDPIPSVSLSATPMPGSTDNTPALATSVATNAATGLPAKGSTHAGIGPAPGPKLPTIVPSAKPSASHAPAPPVPTPPGTGKKPANPDDPGY